MPADPTEPVEDPTEEPELDDAPKTGSTAVMFALSVLLMAPSMSIAVCFLMKRKHF